jgi:hypothetical protein
MAGGALPARAPYFLEHAMTMGLGLVEMRQLSGKTAMAGELKCRWTLFIHYSLL